MKLSGCFVSWDGGQLSYRAFHIAGLVHKDEADTGTVFLAVASFPRTIWEPGVHLVNGPAFLDPRRCYLPEFEDQLIAKVVEHPEWTRAWIGSYEMR